VYKRVLVPLDGSALSENVLPFLTEIAGPLDMTIVLVRVLEPIQPGLVDGGLGFDVNDLEARRRDATEYLAPLAVGLRARGVDTITSVRVGRAEDEILAAARDNGADLIAMSTHGRSGLGRLLFGSIAEQVLRHSDVPVFLMRQTLDRPVMPHRMEAKR
jgi:nucleotide-binding universal stress UspA family protein